MNEILEEKEEVFLKEEDFRNGTFSSAKSINYKLVK